MEKNRCAYGYGESGHQRQLADALTDYWKWTHRKQETISAYDEEKVDLWPVLRLRVHCAAIWTSIKRTVGQEWLGDAAKVVTPQTSPFAQSEDKCVICAYSTGGTAEYDVGHINIVLHNVGCTGDLSNKTNVETLARKPCKTDDSRRSSIYRLDVKDAALMHRTRKYKALKQRKGDELVQPPEQMTADPLPTRPCWYHTFRSANSLSLWTTGRKYIFTLAHHHCVIPGASTNFLMLGEQKWESIIKLCLEQNRVGAAGKRTLLKCILTALTCHVILGSIIQLVNLAIIINRVERRSKEVWKCGICSARIIKAIQRYNHFIFSAAIALPQPRCACIFLSMFMRYVYKEPFQFVLVSPSAAVFPFTPINQQTPSFAGKRSNNMKAFLEKTAMQHHPLRVLETFIEQERAHEQAKQYEEMRFVGYVLEIGYETVTIITSDPFKIAVGGIPRNSLLIMVPSSFERLPLHFTLLRVLESAPTPLSKEVQQTYFELQKKSMPELDVFTQSELQWGALKASVLGMFYAHPDKLNAIEFSGDVNNFVSAHKYRLYSPNDALLNLIVNSMVPDDNRFEIGHLRLTECRLPLPNKPQPQVSVQVSTTDFMGTRTAMFGKTRLGKSNVVKLIAQSLLETTVASRNVGQLIFDINGEYANDNPQDQSRSLRSGYPGRCQVYAFTTRPATPSKPLKLNFYEHPENALRILGSLLRQDSKVSNYISAFTSVELPSLAELAKLPPHGGELARPLRKVQLFWAILKKAGYAVDEAKLQAIAPTGTPASKFSPGFSKELRTAAYQQSDKKLTVPPPPPANLDALVKELEVVNHFYSDNPESGLLTSSSSGKPLFEADEKAMLAFFDPPPGRSGPSLIQAYRKYHHPHAGDFEGEILRYLDAGETVILDLGNANPEVMQYFSDELSNAVFQHQVEKFTNNALSNHFVQLYFEEAHNLFPHNDDQNTIYTRFAKEGAKYQIGMVYSTQSPTTISRDLLAQTENFFIAHLSSLDDVHVLAKVNIAYESLVNDILLAKTPGYVRMLTRSHRFVVSVQANRFVAP